MNISRLENERELPRAISNKNGFAEGWVADGWEMASKEKEAAFQSIETKHDAETKASEVLIQILKASGNVALERRDVALTTLDTLGYNPAEHLSEIAHGKLDMAWAAGLMLVNAALAVAVLLAFGPLWLTILLAFVVLG